MAGNIRSREKAAMITVVVVILLAGLLAACASDDVAGDQHKAIEVAKPVAAAPERNPHPGAQWFPKAGLGLFLNPGISSVEGQHEMSWAMLAGISWNPRPIIPEDYFALAYQYKPDKHDPENWLKAAKAAGFTYTIFVVRHHDGYALWPSKYGDYNTATCIDGRDLIKPFVDACRKVGLKVGLYYSSPDWWYTRRYMSFGYDTKGTPDSPHLGLKHEVVELPEKPKSFDEEYAAYCNGQITELLTNYGKIDLFWFDGGVPGVMSQQEMRRLQPAIVINDRQHGMGDFNTSLYENAIPGTRPDGWWEHCFSMGGSWGYRKRETCYPAGLLLSRLVRCRTWGGNVAAGFAPRPTGEMPDSFYKCLNDMSDWMRLNGKSLRETKPGPYPEKCSAPVTVKGKTWYIFLVPETMDGPAASGTILLKEVKSPARVKILASGTKLPFTVAGDEVTISVPDECRTKNVDVVAVTW